LNPYSFDPDERAARRPIAKRQVAEFVEDDEIEVPRRCLRRSAPTDLLLSCWTVWTSSTVE